MDVLSARFRVWAYLVTQVVRMKHTGYLFLNGDWIRTVQPLKSNFDSHSYKKTSLHQVDMMVQGSLVGRYE